jgi:subtilisin family serine protease
VATGAEIYAGKVFNASGETTDGILLDAITWAVEQECKVISMSLGAPVLPYDSYSPQYEEVGKYALENGSIIVAAAGNDSNREYNYYAPVSSPANCPSILAVGAMDEQNQIGYFSNRGININQEVNIAAPGVDVYSTWIRSENDFHTISGTSMATPFVAGIIALLIEQNPTLRPQEIINKLVSLAKNIGLHPVDAGVGLVQAPTHGNI